MNERIKKLAEQAGFIDRGTNHTAYMNFDHEKFAYLIIRECRDIVGEVAQGIEDEWNVDEAMSTAMFDIEDYFGVK